MLCANGTAALEPRRVLLGKAHDAAPRSYPSHRGGVAATDADQGATLAAPDQELAGATSETGCPGSTAATPPATAVAGIALLVVALTHELGGPSPAEFDAVTSKL